MKIFLSIFVLCSCLQLSAAEKLPVKHGGQTKLVRPGLYVEFLGSKDRIQIYLYQQKAKQWISLGEKDDAIIKTVRAELMLPGRRYNPLLLKSQKDYWEGLFIGRKKVLRYDIKLSMVVSDQAQKKDQSEELHFDVEIKE